MDSSTAAILAACKLIYGFLLLGSLINQYLENGSDFISENLSSIVIITVTLYKISMTCMHDCGISIEME